MAEGQDDDARIAEIRARLEAATPGPWGYNSYSGVFGPPDLCAADDGPDYPESPRPTPGSPEDRVWVAQRSAAYEADPRVCKVPALYGDTAIGRHAADAEFIAHAREDVPWLLARLDALAVEASDVARENETLVEEVKAAGEQIAALAAERDELLVASRECCESMSRAMTAMARDVVTINALRAGLDALAAERDALRARAERYEAALRRGLRIVSETIEAVTPEPCRCVPDEFCGECLAIKTLDQARAALAAASDSISHSGDSSRLSE